jgi:hypothetical protein
LKKPKPKRFQIFEDHSRLQAFLARHEATIRKRWLKQISEQRRKTLLPVWLPDKMSATHHPDSAGFYREAPQDGSQQTVYRSAHIWPYINEEDLVQPRALLMFMHPRVE